MEKKHIAYIDELKGIAIFLVLMGHTLSWCYSNPTEIIRYGEPRFMLSWHFIYAFHMPLFFWVSGFLFPKAQNKKEDIIPYLWRKTYTLLFPCIISGFILRWLTDGVDEGYWFLKALYGIILINFVYELIKWKNNTPFCVDLLFYISYYIVQSILYKYWGKTEIADFLGLSRLGGANFVAFILGVMCRRHACLFNYINKNTMYTLYIVIFTLLFWFRILSGINVPSFIDSIINIFLSISGVLICVYLIKNGLLFSNSHFKVFFSYLGKRSLEIYILHFIFKIAIFPIGDYIIALINSGNPVLQLYGYTLQFLIPTILSMIVLVPTLCLMKILKASKVLSFTLLGRKS